MSEEREPERRAEASPHCSEEDLILHHYGEAAGRSVASHLAACDVCTADYAALTATLALVDRAAIPARDDHYGLEVWQQLRHRLPARDATWRWYAAPWSGLAAAAAVVLLVMAGFVAGRIWPQPPSAIVAGNTRTDASGAVDTVADEAHAGRRRVLMLSVAEHFEESDRMLTEIMNAPDGRDLDAERQWADDLLSASRLYRRDAIDADEASVAAVLDELERALLEIVHSPSPATVMQLDDMKQRIDSAALLFKVRVMGDELRRGTGRNTSPAPARGRLTPQVS